MAKNNSSSSSGIGVWGLLGVVFVTLKLTEVIDWSWWWVTVPFWGGFALFFGVLLGIPFLLGSIVGSVALFTLLGRRLKKLFSSK